VTDTNNTEAVTEAAAPTAAPLSTAIGILGPFKDYWLYAASVRVVTETFNREGFVAAVRHADRIADLFEEYLLRSRLNGIDCE
jgi:hypothetical protein